MNKEFGLKQIILEDREFTQFQSRLYGAAGIHLSPMKKALVAGVCLSACSSMNWRATARISK